MNSIPKIIRKLRTAAALLAAAGCALVFGGEMDNGESYFLQKQYGRAVDCYRKALESKLNDNNRALCWLMVGRSYAQLGHYEDARISFMNIVNLYSKTDWLPEAYVGLGDINFKAKKYSEALKHYRNSQTATFMNRSGSRVLLKIAKTQRNLGNKKEAADCEARILKEYPKSLEARLLMKGGGTSSQAESAPVKKTTQTTSSSSASKPAAKSSGNSKTQFAVQVSYTAKQDLANKYAAQLKKKGFSKAYVRKGTKGYSVLIGNYATKSEAQSVCDKVRKSEKNDSYVISL
ncbi:SPOR domain-containing protein [bacterium]|nr:SPOR domain-containing protein [bacterium]